MRTRRRFTAEERNGLVAAYHDGQMTQQEFAGQQGLGLATLARWLRQERDGTVAPRQKRLDVYKRQRSNWDTPMKLRRRAPGLNPSLIR